MRSHSIAEFEQSILAFADTPLALAVAPPPLPPVLRGLTPDQCQDPWVHSRLLHP